MILVWRLVRDKYATDPMSGEGARANGGRWNDVGIPLIYTSEHRSLAALEVLVHLSGTRASGIYKMLSYELDEKLIEHLPAKDLPPDWQQEPPPGSTVSWGSRWAREKRSVALAVPSAVLPEEKNIILNPDHPDAARVKPGKTVNFTFDPRLLVLVTKIK
jgi:RES domain-containing protein